jgi:predicted short-subunit dehydrogenase-like oxidoreductase (DUF2520 family)
MPVKTKSNRPTISLIGSGNLAQALGPALRAAGYAIGTVAFRSAAPSQRRAVVLAKKLGAKAISLDDARPEAEIIWVCHTDDALPETARLLARKPGWKRKIVVHSSGALTSDVLAPLKRAGAYVASAHPLMTFVPGTQPRFKNIPLAVEGDREAIAAVRKIAARLGAEFFMIGKKSKVLYHALGSFSSPLLVATLATAERVGRAAGLSRTQTRKMIGPIIEQTIRNYLERGAAAAFSGPIKRGDINTLRRHLGDLRKTPEAREVYRALVRSALRELPAKNARKLMALLQEES